MWCPSVSLSVWSNAWLAGHAAPDDVLDALSAWAPSHSVMAYDAVAAGRTGLPWPDVDRVGPMSLLQMVRSGVGPAAGAGRPPLETLLPVPGDVRGLPPGTQFAQDAMAAGEAVVVMTADGGAIGVIPTFECDEPADEPAAYTDDLTLCWSAYSLPGAPAGGGADLGEAEYEMRAAVRSAAEALGALELACGPEDPRAMVEELLEAAGHHRIPDHAPPRAVRVLNTAAHVDAILTVGSGLTSIGVHSSSEARIADTAMRPLAAAVRAARGAAVGAILQSAWEA